MNTVFKSLAIGLGVCCLLQVSLQAAMKPLSALTNEDFANDVQGVLTDKTGTIAQECDKIQAVIDKLSLVDASKIKLTDPLDENIAPGYLYLTKKEENVKQIKVKAGGAEGASTVIETMISKLDGFAWKKKTADELRPLIKKELNEILDALKK